MEMETTNKDNDVLVYDLASLESDLKDSVFKSSLHLESRQVIFKLNKKSHVKMMAELVKTVQKHNLTGRREIENFYPDEKDEFCPVFWPDHWRIHIFIDQKRELSLEEDFPYELWTLPNVDVLSIKSCGLKSIPYSIGYLKSLKKLDVTNNHLKDLPSSLQFCQNLVELKVAQNYLDCLPAFIMQMKNIECLTTHGNSAIFTHFSLPRDPNIPVLTSKKDNAEDGNGVTKLSPRRLYHLAAIETLKLKFTNEPLDFSELGLPRSIVIDLLSLFPDLKFCYNCKCGFTENEYHIVSKNFEDFRGYKNIVFRAVFCCIFCAEKVLKQWNLIAEEEKSKNREEQYCFDVEPDTETIVPFTATTSHNFLHKLCCFSSV